LKTILEKILNWRLRRLPGAYQPKTAIQKLLVFGHSIWWLRGNPKAQNPEGRDASRAPPGAVQKRLG